MFHNFHKKIDNLAILGGVLVLLGLLLLNVGKDAALMLILGLIGVGPWLLCRLPGLLARSYSVRRPFDRCSPPPRITIRTKWHN